MTVPGKILDILLYVLFSSTDLPTTVMACLYLAGLWAVFVKCGLKGWWALIPVARIYKLALCADREQEGRTLSVIQTDARLQHARQAAQQCLEERVDGLDAHVVVVKQHRAETLVRPLCQLFVRRLLTADHERTRA